MKNWLSSLALILVGLFLFQTAVFSQTRKKKSSKVDEYFDQSQGFKHRLWYGAGAILGFSGDQNSSLFAIGVSPKVGYKITEEFSVGPKFSVLYSNYRFRDVVTDEVFPANGVDWAVGAFGRYKLFQNLFAQVEFESENKFTINSQGGFIQLDQNGDIATSRQQQNNVFIGGGYNSGGLVSGEIVILYNTNLPSDSFDSPLEIRFGFTYNF